MSVSKAEQAVTTVSPATIATLSSGEFVGIVADDPAKRVERKRFHAEIIREEGVSRGMEELPIVRAVTEKELDENFERVRKDIKELVEQEMKRVMGDPALKGKVVKR
jgi:GTPase Era involved in 16S rRNA processing